VGLDQGESPIEVPITTLGEPPVNQVTLTGLTTADIYTFVATAYDDMGNESGFSNKVQYGLPPNTPTELTAQYDGVNIELSWTQDNSIPVDYWKIFFRFVGDTEWIEFGSIEYSETPIFTAPFTAVKDGEEKAVEFTVIAFRDVGTFSSDAIYTSVTIDRKPPTAPALDVVVNMPVQ